MSASKPDLTTTAGKLADLRQRLAEAQAPLGSEVVEATHAEGKSTARERVLQLLDPETFTETDALARHRIETFGMDRTKPATDGVVTGYGLVNGRRVCVFSQDPTIFDGTLGEVYAEKILKIYDLATKTGVPLIGIYDSAGPRIQEGIVTAAMYAKILRAATEASGLIPQLAIVTGAVTDIAALTVPLSDITIAVEGASVSISGESTDNLAHITAPSDTEAVEATRKLIGFLPMNNLAESPLAEVPDTIDATGLDEFMPDDDSTAYNVHDILAKVTDGDLVELKADQAKNIVTGFAHISGRSVAVVANQPTAMNGQLTAAAAEKAARFIRMADAFNLPIVQFVDSPGFADDAPASAAKLAYAFAEAQVGTITVVTRKALGAAYVVMGSKDLGADLAFAWPTAQIALTDANTAAAKLETDAAEYGEANINPYIAAERGLIDAVIEPANTRASITEGLRLLERKVLHPRPKKHGNIPL
ncbi:carboxyl transferase domain-containing protein [Corynebacterium breve]|uniref:Carboxyl transferase domain-containing protein n=1 Tax=Corynebacterium breve TaxID=3049799 RepID=A0ABY8VHW8_9CORY|nr:carboxyl transferase domain-containing protein [Corynebacterium breve]WIM68228.1 carboxyl transferase domain-containing protein [Corynebacterium breve]